MRWLASTAILAIAGCFAVLDHEARQFSASGAGGSLQQRVPVSAPA
jgi:hypothetical protein